MSIKTKQAFIGQHDLDHIKQQTIQLKQNLEENNLENALLCINEINEVNSRNFYDLIGKLTRGLHHAISELDISDSHDYEKNNRKRVDLNYVIEVTHDAAGKTLDMTEKAMSNIKDIQASEKSNIDLIDAYLADNKPDSEVAELLGEIKKRNIQNSDSCHDLSKFTSEIVLAQNYQDLASQSITKAIDIINEVEGSLVTLTQYTNLLKKLSRFGTNGFSDLDDLESESLKSDLDQFNSVSSEHLDQNEVDNLLSSLGF